MSTATIDMNGKCPFWKCNAICAVSLPTSQCRTSRRDPCTLRDCAQALSVRTAVRSAISVALTLGCVLPVTIFGTDTLWWLQALTQEEAALRIQRIGRGMIARRRVARESEAEEVFIGMRLAVSPLSTMSCPLSFNQ